MRHLLILQTYISKNTAIAVSVQHVFGCADCSQTLRRAQLSTTVSLHTAAVPDTVSTDRQFTQMEQCVKCADSTDSSAPAPLFLSFYTLTLLSRPCVAYILFNRPTTLLVKYVSIFVFMISLNCFMFYAKKSFTSMVLLGGRSCS